MSLKEHSRPYIKETLDEWCSQPTCVNWVISLEKSPIEFKCQGKGYQTKKTRGRDALKGITSKRSFSMENWAVLSILELHNLVLRIFG